MFYRAINFNQDISDWDTSQVRRMMFMFFNATNFNQDISDWNVSSVTTMYGMFQNGDASPLWHLLIMDNLLTSGLFITLFRFHISLLETL